jgi:probable F420-dependent oxidoreductase
VNFGLTCFLTAETIEPGELGRMAEERGFESLLLPEHTHIPSSRESPFPGGELPDYYSRLWDPFIACATIAAATERLRVGTAVSLVAQHDPIVLAKTVASLDQLSGGRVLLGVGAGWNREEAADHGIDPARRFAAMDERVAAMREIWSSDLPSFQGEEVAFERIWSWPKPHPGGPTVLVGSNGPGALDRVLAYGDEWMPVCLWDFDAVLDRIGDLRRRAAEAGREVGVTAYLPPPEPDALERLEAAGVGRAVFMLPSAGRAEVEPALEELVGVRRDAEGRAF